MKFIKPSAIALVVGLALWFVSFSLASRLPPPAAFPEIHEDPAQTETQAQPVEIDLKGHKYGLKPRFDYRIRGRVVAMTDAMGWTDISHRAWGDYLNTHDLCIVWGADAEVVDLREFSITHGDWTCYYYTRSRDEFAKFRPDQFSNNHILPASGDIAALVRDVRIGDIVDISGQLVDYSIDGRGSRNTSTVRTDTGNGACEIIYVTGFQFIQRHNEKLYQLASLGKLVSILGGVALLLSLFVAPFVFTER